MGEIPGGTANTWLLPRVRKWLPYLDAHRNDVSLRGLRPWTNGDDRPFVHLRHRGIREDDSPTDFCMGATRSTKTLSRRGTKRFKPPDMSLPLCLSVALSRSPH